jgi:uncharacterized protein YnzC (UPF0291/DUF896 family)
MLSPEKIARINELAKKKKTEGLTPNEQKEQDRLRKEYLKSVKHSLTGHISTMKIVDEKGNDVTPKKVKALKKDSNFSS